MIEVLENFSSNETKIGQTKIVAFDSDLNEFKSIPKNDIIITETSQIKTTKARKLSQGKQIFFVMAYKKYVNMF